MTTVAVLTFPMTGKNGKTYVFPFLPVMGNVNTCNMVEGLDVTMGRIKERFDELQGNYEISGDIILNFVATED